ncbi:MAG: hypothetical protein ACJAYU_000263 [Bradymonadia bacterium]|jgi:hypothetical protein
MTPLAADAGAFTNYDFETGQPLHFELKPPILVVLPAVISGAALPIEDIAMSSYRETDPTFASYGVDTGNFGPDVPLYGIDGSMTSVREASAERPTLFIAVSLTCPIARAAIARAIEVAALFDGAIDVKLVYVVEAHPSNDPSPYVGAEWPSPENTLEGILYQQPRTFGVRAAMAEMLVTLHDVQLPMLVDGPGNEWWNTYGPAPNNAVLLAPDGTVLLEHGWFDGEGLDIVGDLIEVLPRV